MKLYEIYPRTSNRIQATDSNLLDTELTISNVEVSGKDRKTVWIEFQNESLRYKCTKKDVVDLFRELKTDDTEKFEGNKLVLTSENNKVNISEIIPKDK